MNDVVKKVLRDIQERLSPHFPVNRVWDTLVVRVGEADVVVKARAYGDRSDSPDFDPWGEDPQKPRSEWVKDVLAGNTSVGYWAWVDGQVEVTN